MTGPDIGIIVTTRVQEAVWDILASLDDGVPWIVVRAKLVDCWGEPPEDFERDENAPVVTPRSRRSLRNSTALCCAALILYNPLYMG